MRLLRFRIRTLMIAVAVVAVGFVLLRTPIGVIIATAIGPTVGILVDRRRGGWGILGGAIGGALEMWAFYAYWLLQDWFHRAPNSTNFHPVDGLFESGEIGAVMGALMGLLVWGVDDLWKRVGPGHKHGRSPDN